MKKLSNLFILLALILSHVMCVVVSYNYCSMQWGIQYAGYSAPASIAFLYIIPYGIGILACLVSAIVLRKKRK